jgi:hypothetical protein
MSGFVEAKSWPFGAQRPNAEVTTALAPMEKTGVAQMAADLLHRLEIAFGGQSPRSQGLRTRRQMSKSLRGVHSLATPVTTDAKRGGFCKLPPSSRGQCWSALGRGRSFFGERGIAGRLTAPIRARTCVDALLENR